MPQPTDPSSSFGALPAVFLAVFVVILAVGIGTTVYRLTRMASRGQNPLTVTEDLAYRATHSTALAPERSKADRLAELEALLHAGTITQAERDAARARVLEE